jgi:hypothetical protein
VLRVRVFASGKIVLRAPGAPACAADTKEEEGMQKWEYLVLMYGADGWYANGVKLEGGQATPLWQVYKDRGAEGWELVSVDGGLAYFKRPRQG